MSVNLYHFTSRAAASRILATGFDGSTCWLSPDPETVCGESARSALLVVELAVAVEELDQFRRVIRDEVWDEGTRTFVPDASSPAYDWYEVPVELIRIRGRVGLAGDDERRTLMMA